MIYIISLTQTKTLGSATKFGGRDKNPQKRAGKYWVSCTSPTGRYTYRQDVVTTQTRRRVGDVYCTASRRSTTTSPKPQTSCSRFRQAVLTDRSGEIYGISMTRPAVSIASTVFDECLGQKDQVYQ